MEQYGLSRILAPNRQRIRLMISYGIGLEYCAFLGACGAVR